MEKTVEISGRIIKLKATTGSLLRYRQQFGKDMLKDLFEIHNSGELNFEVILNLLWSLAKTADDKIPDPITFFDEISFVDLSELAELLCEVIFDSFGVSESEKKQHLTMEGESIAAQRSTQKT